MERYESVYTTDAKPVHDLDSLDRRCTYLELAVRILASGEQAGSEEETSSTGTSEQAGSEEDTDDAAPGTFTESGYLKPGGTPQHLKPGMSGCKPTTDSMTPVAAKNVSLVTSTNQRIANIQDRNRRYYG
jgi:hypothetical protein